MNRKKENRDLLLMVHDVLVEHGVTDWTSKTTSRGHTLIRWGGGNVMCLGASPDFHARRNVVARLRRMLRGNG
jgi:hypothetical protein